MPRRNTSQRGNRSHHSYAAAIVVLFVLGIVLYGIYAGGGITGFATSQNVNINITVGNNAPYIYNVSSVSSAAVSEGTTSAFTFTFTAADIDGVTNLNDASAEGRINQTGQSDRVDTSCSLLGDVNSTDANYECSVNIWYFDGPGSWTLNVTIQDSNGASDADLDSTFTLNQTLAMTLGPTALTWPSLSLSSTNQTASNDPTTVNNTANANANVSVTALDLHGETTTTEKIGASNFTIGLATGGSPAVECDDTQMVNGTSTGIEGATLPRGNNTASSGQEDLYYCITNLDPSISSQSYSTSFLGTWTVAVSAV